MFKILKIYSLNNIFINNYKYNIINKKEFLKKLK